MASGVDAWLKWLAGIVAVVVGLPVLLVYVLFWYGSRDLPETLPHASHPYPESLRQLYWQVELGGRGKPSIDRHGPVGMLVANVRDMDGRTRADQWRPDPSVSLPYFAARTSLLSPAPPSHWHTQAYAQSVRFSRHRTATEMIDLLLDRGYFPGDVHGLDDAARVNYGVPPVALAREEALALIVSMRSPLHSLHCRDGWFDKRYLAVAQRQGLRADNALQAARRRLRPLPCPI